MSGRGRPAAPLPARHVLPAELFARLAKGGGGPTGLGLLRAAEHSRRLLLLAAVRDAAERHGAGGDRTLEAWRLLARAQHRAPGTVDGLLAYPSVGPRLIRSLELLRGRAEDADPALASGAAPAWDLRADGEHGLPSLAAAAAVVTGLRAHIRLPVRGGNLVLPGLGAARFPEVPDGVLASVGAGPRGGLIAVGADRVAVLAAPGDAVPDGPRWEGLRALASLGRDRPLLLDDLDPATLPMDGRCGRLPADTLASWRQVVAAGWDLLRDDHPEVAAEARALLRALVPIEGPAGSTRSGSAKETFGAVALTAPESALRLALTLTHELQHNKLSALLHLVDLTEERPGESFYAPWRQDPRPLIGLLHGAYAHLGVARFWRQRLALEPTAEARYIAQVEFVRWRDGAARVSQTLLGSGRLTAPGVRFVTLMRDALHTLRLRTPVSAAATAEGLAAATWHHGEWTARNGATERADGPAGTPR